MEIVFDGEAGEAYHTLLKNLIGWGGEVTTDNGETIEGIITAVGNEDDIQWYGTIYMQRGFESTGEVVKVVAERVKVY